MAVYDLFSKRKAAQLGAVPELQTENLPLPFRRQVVKIFEDSIGPWTDAFPNAPQNQAWEFLFGAVTREHGVFHLGDPYDNPFEQCEDHLLNAGTDKALDMMELTLRYIDGVVRKWKRHERNYVRTTQSPDSAIQEFNARCRENGVGYAYEEGSLVSVSSAFVHTEVVQSALVLLHDEGFRGAQDEFHRAHTNLRSGDHKGAIVEAGKAFESAMKTVCANKGWAYDPHKTTASGLVAILFDKEFVPSFLQEQFTSLRKVFESGVPTIRNKTSGHGQGPEPVDVPRELAEYAVHLAAANIVFLAKSLKRGGRT